MYSWSPIDSLYYQELFIGWNKCKFTGRIITDKIKVEWCSKKQQLYVAFESNLQWSSSCLINCWSILCVAFKWFSVVEAEGVDRKQCLLNQWKLTVIDLHGFLYWLLSLSTLISTQTSQLEDLKLLVSLFSSWQHCYQWYY